MNKLKLPNSNLNTLSNGSRITNIYSSLNLPSKSKKSLWIYKQESDEKDLLSDIVSSTIKLPDKKSTASYHELAIILMENFIFKNVSDILYHWHEEKGYYIAVTTDYAEKFIRRNIPTRYKSRITTNSIREIIQWIKAELTIDSQEELVQKKGHLIAFSNGIFDIDKERLLTHTPSYFFTSVINAEYREDNSVIGNHFERFLLDITDGNQSLYLRIQELFGYVVSEVRNVKYIPYLLGPKDTGKSIILKVLEHLVGKDSYTNLSFDQLNKPEYLAELLGKRLNTCGETSEFRLNKLDVFKKLSGGDHVTARAIYGQPVNFVNSSVLLFAGNHLPTINGIDKSNAFSQRMIIFPFLNQVPKSKQDPQLFEKLLEEKEYIAKWAVEGLIRWIENNYQFTSYSEVEELSEAYCEQNNSIDSFIKTNCKLDVSCRIYKSEIEEAYITYCKTSDLLPESSKVLNDYIKSLPNISFTRFRDGQGNNKYGYKGITLQNDFIMEE